MLFGQSRVERGNPAATAMLMASVLASVGCDRVESPFAPDFGVEKPPQLSVSAEPPAAAEPPEAGEPPVAAIDAPRAGGETADPPVKTPGVWRVEPGEPESVMLRGSTSISTDCRSVPPLIVIDGVVQPEDFHISGVEALDIDHVEVVKGAAATMLYGPRAANGAIDIQTKRGTQATILNGLKPR